LEKQLQREQTKRPIGTLSMSDIVADYQKRSGVAVRPVSAILRSSAMTHLRYRDQRGLIVGEAVVTLATSEYFFKRPVASLTMTR